MENDCEVPDSRQGQYQRTGVFWKDEELNRKALEYIRVNNVVKGRPNMTIAVFCEWINEDLLPNITLEPGFSCRVSVETARCWLHELGFSVMRASKGTFVDGHEREDVVEYSKNFICLMVGLGFINNDKAVTNYSSIRRFSSLKTKSLQKVNYSVPVFPQLFHSN